MDNHPHVIGRQIFDVDFSSKEKSDVLQDKISLIFNNRLMDEMNQLFDRILPSNRIIKVDTLIIDIGEIGFESLDTELPKRIIQKIEEELRLILLHDNAAAVTNSEDIFQDDTKGNYLQLLEFFLQKGSFPWWVTSTEGLTISEVLEFLLLHASLRLKELVMRLGKDYNVRKRLVYQFSEQQIRYIIIVIEPDEAEFIFDYQHNLVQVQKEIVLVKNEESDFKRAVWLLIVSFLIVDRGSHFNRKEFVKNMLINMAAHFNTDFSELLALFAAGLKSNDRELRDIDSLYSIILELFTEGDASQEKKTNISKDKFENKLPELSNNLELIRYYLIFGSFPWWSTYSDQKSLDMLITSMLDTKPKSMAILLRSIGQKQYSRRLLVKRFKEEILRSIVKIIEPQQVEFITDYIIEAKENNNRDSKIKVQSQELTEAIWEFVLEYLLVDRGSEFNRQMFLESNIRNLANRFNISFADLLVFLVQSIGVRHHHSTRHISLIRDLSELYKSHDKALATTFSSENINELNLQIPQIIESKNLRDLLYYWLKLGHYPWWASEKYSNTSISVLIEQLFKESPTETVIFLKFAGQSLIARTRILNQVSKLLMIKLFRNLPDGNKAFRYSEKIIELFSGNPFFQSIEKNMMDRISLASLWDMYKKNYYESFKPGDFLASFIVNLSLSMDISIKKITLFLNSLVFDKQVSAQLNKVFRYLEENSDGLDPLLSNRKFPAWSKLIEIEHLLNEQLRSENIENNQIPFDKLLNEATFILRYFLRFNKLPQRYKQSSIVSINTFLKQLLLFLHKNSVADLDKIISSEKYDAQNIFRLHDLLGQSNSIEENSLKNFLATKFERNILLFIRQKSQLGFNEKSLFHLIENLTQNPISENKNILALLLKSPSVSIHLARFLTDSLVYDMLNTELKNNVQIPAEIKILNEWLQGILYDRLDRERLELFIRSFNLMMYGGIIKASTINANFIQLIEFLTENNYQLTIKIISSISQSLKSSNEYDRLIMTQIPDLRKLSSRLEKIETKMEDLKIELKTTEKSSIENFLNIDPDELNKVDLQLKMEIQEQLQEEQKKSVTEFLSDKDSIYIHNAGLVILHPFLSTYFNRLNMIKDGDFMTEEFRHRAVHLLQYLAFGTENNEEHELVLNKILCNIPIDQPISSGISLTELERKVSGELLNAVLVQWEKLKNTSAESFQASFIQRNGALSRIQDNWNLKVEDRGYDVLLDTLPWGLGMIKTPWMTEFIYVEWR